MMDGMDKKVTKNENANAKAGNKNLLLSKWWSWFKAFSFLLQI
jgi:hypothetical protein